VTGNHLYHRSDWESPLPERYLTPVVPGPHSLIMSGLAHPAISVTSFEPSVEPPAIVAPPRESSCSTLVQNVAYNDALLPYRATGKRVRDVIKAALEQGHPIPKTTGGKEMCVSYHVKVSATPIAAGRPTTVSTQQPKPASWLRGAPKPSEPAARESAGGTSSQHLPSQHRYRRGALDSAR
jgi:hypothetical protein